MSRWQLPNHSSQTMLRHETSLGKIWFQSRRKQLCAVNWAFLSPAQKFRTCDYSILSNQQAVDHLPISRRKYINYTAVKSENAFLNVMPQCITAALLCRCNSKSLRPCCPQTFSKHGYLQPAFRIEWRPYHVWHSLHNYVHSTGNVP